MHTREGTNARLEVASGLDLGGDGAPPVQTERRAHHLLRLLELGERAHRVLD